MKFFLSAFATLLLFTYLACSSGTEGVATSDKQAEHTKENVSPMTVDGQPVSKQSADLTSKSLADLEREKLELVDEMEGGSPSNKLNAKLSTKAPVAAAAPSDPKSVKTMGKEAIKVSDVKVAVNEKPTAVNVVKKDNTKVKVNPEVKPSTIENADLNNNTTNTTEVKTDQPKEKEAPIVKNTKVDHSPFDALLQKHVSSSGKVNYKGIKSDQSKLDAYLKALSENPVQNDWSRSEKMAYWINTYNAYTIKLIVDNYPLKSITDLEGGKPWDKKWIKVGSDTYSLDHIENGILRPQFNEPAIHFAVNCAAKSCPPLLNRAWTADNLKTNFKKQATAFINNSNYNKVAADKVEVSKIFDWYKADFGNLVEYLNRYSTTKIDAGATVGYMEYDWNLNE